MMRNKKKDGVVIDHQTGLIWQKKYTKLLKWNDAIAYPASLGAGWRLPTVYELFGIVDFGREDPTCLFSGMLGKRFWSSTFAGGSSSAWYVAFDIGFTSYGNRTYYNHVRCCRSSDK